MTPDHSRPRLRHVGGTLLLAALLGAGCSPEVEGPALAAADSADLVFDLAHLDRIDIVVAEALEAGRMPGCVVAVGRSSGVVFQRAYGAKALEPEHEEMTADTVFDLASLTKPIATATSVMLLLERGRLRLDQPVASWLPEFGNRGKETITVRQLLTHTGGLIPDNALADYQDGPAAAWQRLFALELRDKPGTRFTYTDVGFEVLGALVERLSGQSLDAFVQDNLCVPLGLEETSFRPPPELAARAAPTEQRDGRWLRGEVHDPRAALLGGVAGHAGLFSTASDLGRFARMLLAGGVWEGRRVLAPRTVELLATPQYLPGGVVRALGWDVRSPYSRNRGDLYSERAFGHGGFTGTVLWIDPGLDLFVVFLSNRVHPDGKGSVNDLAGRIGSIAAGALEYRAGAGPRRRDAATLEREVLTGIDVLERQRFDSLAGLRIGLITNHTGRTRDGRRSVDVLHQAPQVELKVVFSPEHGIEGRLDGSVGDGTDAATGLPVVSLYGESRRPSAEHLAGLDALVFDIQDAGTRFYTYVSTMGLAMEEAARHGLRFVVLDRPNPIDGVTVEGPLLDEGAESFTAHHRIPVRHAMTVGELAGMFADERGLEVDLRVVELEGWQRHAWYDATGLPWVDPSPNLRSLRQALLYPGVALLEFTNVSVGRGTDTPFELLAAPWIDGRALARRLRSASLAGVTFLPREFTPSASVFAGEPCGGIELIVTDRDRFQSVRTGLEIACALRDLFPEHWESDRYGELLGSARLLAALHAGRPAAELAALARAGLDDFTTRRTRYLLYP